MTNLSPSNRFLAERLTKKNKNDERRKMIALAREVDDVINLGRGDPDLDTPPHIIEYAKKALDEGATHYTPWAGLPELRKAVAEKMKKEKNLDIDPEKEIIITVGAQEAIFLTMMALINPGEEIIVPEPRYTPYDSSIELAGGMIVPVVAKPENEFEVQVEDIKKAITEKTKAIILISPNNPTGSVLSEETLKAIADLAEQEDLLIISDEIYGDLLFEEAPKCTIESLPRMFERTIIVHGISKSYSMTGWRIGYLIAHKDLISPMLNLKYALTICAPAVSQKAALAALTGPQKCLEDTVAIYDERRRVTMKRLDRLGLDYVVPKGSFYIFPDIRKFRMTSYEFASTLLKHTGVFTFPGTAFGPAGEGFIRISLLVDTFKIEEAFNRLEEFIKKNDLL